MILSNEAIAAYITAVASILVAIFAFIGQNRERNKNKRNANELEQFKQKLELYLSFKKESIVHAGQLLNYVYNIRVTANKAKDLEDIELQLSSLITSLQAFEKFYRENAHQTAELGWDVRSYAHDSLHHLSQLTHLKEKIKKTGLSEKISKDSIEIFARIWAHTCMYEDFLRSVLQELRNSISHFSDASAKS
ncbi:hypothetical protein ACFOTA_18325 [Chitinophaga sp. GCM10012297]|uniref:DUF4760 domain-containing protein n=1 Tax=Chitinophaga chungangae TaxID=2821488 RepID=A0ABS3YIP1_9BACT|nr:hypothetical protein [Chitinophaga chungangae]MBO9154178.1 hypothetical protein [Chitinophaga chungangae]